LFRVWHVALAAAFGGPLPAATLLAVNDRRLGRSLWRALGFVVLGAIAAVVLVVLRWMTVSLWWIPLHAAGILCVYGVAGLLQGAAVESHARAGGRFVSSASAFLLGLGGAGATVVGCLILFLLVIAVRGPVFWFEWQMLEPRTLYGSCDMRRGHPSAAELSGGPVHGDEKVCVELWDGTRSASPTHAAQARHLCHDDWSEGPCGHAGALGKCWTPSVIHWWYPSSTIRTADDVKDACEERGLDFGQP
jgi:hypothetical protein